MKKLCTLLFTVFLLSCSNDEVGSEYVFIYHDYCQQKLDEVIQRLKRSGISATYEVIEPTRYPANQEFFNKLVKIEADQPSERVDAYVNSYFLRCGVNGYIEIEDDKVLSKEEVENLIKRFGAADKKNAELRYINGKLYITYSESLPAGPAGTE